MAVSSHFASQSRVILAGSEKKPYVGELAPVSAAAVPAAKPAARMGRITVSVVVPPKTQFVMKRGKPQERLTRATFATRHGASPTSLKLVRAFAKEFGLTAEPIGKPGTCTIHLSGSAAAVQKAFGCSLKLQASASGTYRVREGTLCIPKELDGHILAVLGLDNRPQARPHFRIARPHAVNASYTPVQVGALYGFPATATASGQTIGIIELGGGYRTADLTA